MYVTCHVFLFLLPQLPFAGSDNLTLEQLFKVVICIQIEKYDLRLSGHVSLKSRVSGLFLRLCAPAGSPGVLRMSVVASPVANCTMRPAMAITVWRKHACYICRYKV